MKIPFPSLLLAAAGLLALNLTAHATPMVYDISGSLPYSYGFGLGVFSNTTFNGTISFDTGDVSDYNGGTVAQNALFTLDFSNGLHGSFTDSFVDNPDWYGNSLLSTAGPAFVINGNILGFFQGSSDTLENGNGSASGYTVTDLYFTFGAGAGPLGSNLDLTNGYFQLNVNDAGLGGFTTTLAAAPEPSVWMDLALLALLAPAATFARRFSARRS